MELVASYFFFVLGGLLYVGATRALLQVKVRQGKLERANAARVKLHLAAQRWRR